MWGFNYFWILGSNCYGEETTLAPRLVNYPG